MNNFLRARFRHFSINSIKNNVRPNVGLLCGMVALMAVVLSPLDSFAGFCLQSAVPTPSFASPQLVCSGNAGVLTLNITTLTNGGADWTATYVLDSSDNGGANWYAIDTNVIGYPTTAFIYNTPIFTNTGTSCYQIQYRFRLSGINNNCSGGPTMVTPVAVFNVCPAPAPITGSPTSICVGQSTTFSVVPPSPAPSTWSSNNTAAATVTSGGVVSGVGPGIATIFYTNSSGCSSTRVVTVNALPAPIVGPTSLCVGATPTYSLSAAPFTGAWSSAPTAGGINPVSGAYNATPSGLDTITFTNPAGCTATLAITVNNLPTMQSLTPTGTTGYCAGSAGVPLGLSGSETGVNYQLYNGAATVGAPQPGTGGPIFFGVQPAGTYSVLATLGTCTLAMTGVATLTVTPAPPAIAGAGSLCAGTTTTYTDAAIGWWATAGTMGVGTIDATSGVFTALNPGVDTIVFTDSVSGCSTTRTVTVLATPSAIAGPTAVCIGATVTLTSTPAGGAWTSSAPGVVANVSSTGVVTGVGAGTAIISYTLPGGCRDTAVVTVSTAPTAITGPSTVCNGSCISMSSTPPGGVWSVFPAFVATIDAAGLLCGTSTGLASVTYTLGGVCFTTTTVNVLPAPTAISGPHIVCLGQTITLTNGTTGGTWSSSNTTNAPVVSTTGVVSGSALGTAIISYATSGGCVATHTVTVEPTPAPITGGLALCEGQTSLLSTTSIGGTWISSNPAIGSVDSVSGVWEAILPGTTILQYVFPTGCRSSAVGTVNPLPAAITGPTSVCQGSSITLSTTSTGGSWSSSLPPFGSINATTGVLTGILPGTTFVTYSITATGCSRGVTVTINPNPLPIDGTPIVCVGSTITLTNASPGGPGTWSSSNPAIGAINPVTGVVTGVAAGVCTITFRLPTTCFTTVTLTVNPLPAPITGYPRTCIGFCKFLFDATPGGTWSSSDLAVATIDGTTGSLCGVASGTSVISYTLPTGCATLVIATVDPTPAPPTGILSICVGGTTTLSHTIIGGTWTSSDTIVAKVFMGTGLVTGYVAGTADITYTTPAGCTAVATVTVNPVPPASTGTLYMCEGNTTTLSNLYPGGAWSSSPTSVGTVDAFGVVTGIAAGTVVVSYTLPSGCGVTSIVTVYPLPAIIGSVLVCPGVAAPLTGSPAGGLWASSSPGIATIGSLSGVVMGIATGTSTITYTLATTCRSFAEVTVQPLPAAITGPTQVCVGSTITLLNFTTGGGTWISSVPSVGSIDPTTGVLTGLNAGTTTVTFTATATGCITTAVVTVNPLPGAIIVPSTVCAGSTIVLTSSPGGGTWSSAGTFATVNPTTGVVTGITAGVEEITYTLPTGCLTTALVTVEPLPLPIAGSTSICFGYTTLLSSGTPGGVWSISPLTIATIDPLTGLVSATPPVSPSGGTATVTYTMPSTGCFVTTIITVNPLPDTITGLFNICLNDTTTLHSATPGGMWDSENWYIAVIGSTSGLLSSVSAGTVTITYTLPTGCYTTRVITINPTPQPITGPLSVCQGYTVTLANITTGGSWSSSNPAIAFVGSATGDVTGISPGVAYITYTLPTSCPRVVQFTVNPNPAPITGPLSICQGDTVFLSSTTTGGTWFSSNGLVAFIFMPTGQMIGVSVDTATIIYRLPTGCFASVIVTVNPVPTAISILGSRQVCVGATSTPALSNPAFPGGSWSVSPVPLIVTITSSGAFTGVSPGVATITYTLPTGCDTFIQVTVNPLPAAIGGVLSVCEGGGTTTLTSSPGGGTWSSSPATVGTIDPVTGIFTGITAGLANVTYKLAATGCEITAVVTVNPLPAVIIGIDNICFGSTSILSSAPGGGGWSGGGSITTLTVLTADFDSVLVTGIGVGVTTITYTLPTGCYSVKSFTVNPLPFPIHGPDTVCVGSTITLVDTPMTISGTGKWFSSNPSVATIDSVTGVLTGVSAGTVTITYRYTTGCFAIYTVRVHPLPAPIVVPANVCVTYSVLATATPAGGTWSISDTLTATISPTGVVTGVSPGVVTITYKLYTGCFQTATINVRPLPVITVSTPTIVCKYASVTVTASGADSYTWTPPTGLSATTGAVVVASPTITTTYTVIGTTIYGCMDTTTVKVLIDSLLNDIKVTGKDSICKGDCTVLIASGRQGTFFNWKPAPGLSCTICDTTTACPVSTTTYTMVAVDSLGCRDSLAFRVNVMPLPVMSVTPNPAIVCNGSSTQLHITDAFSTAGYATRFAWFPNSAISCTGPGVNDGPDTCADPYVFTTSNLVYRVIGVTPFGCHDSLRVPVTVLDSAFNSINRDTVICEGGTAQLNAISFNPDGARSDFIWSPAGNGMSNEFIHNPIVRPTTTTTYRVIITPNVCWPDTLYTTVVVAPIPDVSITIKPNSTTVTTGSQVTLTGVVNNDLVISSYAWSSTGYLSCDSCYSTIAIPTVTTTYTFAVTSIYGCTDYATVTLNVGCDNSQVFIPNTFTPNGDGMNDRFYISGKGLSNISKFLIYNRWGELVYERYNIQPNDAAAGWDGQYKGIVLPPDVFVFVIEATCNAGNHDVFKYKGDVSIVR